MLNWIRLADKVASRSLHRKYPMGAVIVRSGVVLSLAPNGPRWGAHAELRALTKCCTDPRGSTVVVSRLTGNRMARPCGMCLGALRAAGVRRFVYTVDGGFRVEEV